MASRSWPTKCRLRILMPSQRLLADRGVRTSKIDAEFRSEAFTFMELADIVRLSPNVRVICVNH